MPNETRNSALFTLAEVSRIAQENVLTYGKHAPTVIAEGDRRTLIVQIDPLAPTHAGRAEQMFVLGLTLAASGEVGVLQQVFFVSEAWMSIAEPGKPLELPPSEDPQRREVLMIAQHVLKPVANKVVAFEMQRDGQGLLKTLEPAPAREKPRNEEARSPLIEAFVIGFLGSALLPDD